MCEALLQQIIPVRKFVVLRKWWIFRRREWPQSGSQRVTHWTALLREKRSSNFVASKFIQSVTKVESPHLQLALADNKLVDFKQPNSLHRPAKIHLTLLHAKLVFSSEGIQWTAGMFHCQSFQALLGFHDYSRWEGMGSGRQFWSLCNTCQMMLHRKLRTVWQSYPVEDACNGNFHSNWWKPFKHERKRRQQHTLTGSCVHS